MKMTLTAAIIAVLLLICTLVSAADIWYEDNNMAIAGGIPKDFKDKFNDPDTWGEARKYIKVYFLRVNMFTPGNNLTDDFVKGRMLPLLRESNIHIGLDALGGTMMARELRRKAFEMEIALIEKLNQMGGTVEYVSLQSLLSKTIDEDGKEAVYPIEQRISDAITYASVLKKKFPWIKVGIIDALPSHGREYKGPYARLAKAFSDNGLKLAYVDLDLPYELVKDRLSNLRWSKIKEVELFVQNQLGARFGLICTSRNGGYNSDRAFHMHALAEMSEYMNSGGNPDHFTIMSWFPHPAYTVPDTSSGNHYPVMRTILEFGRLLDQSQPGRRPDTMPQNQEPATN